jgi:hypothetical protein
MKRVYQLVCLVILGSCSSNNPNQVEINPNAKSGRSEYIITAKEKVDSNLASRLYKTQDLSKKSRKALEFVQWILHERIIDEEFKIHSIKNENRFEGFDMNYYLNKIEESGFVTERFIEIQNEKLEKFNKKLEYYHLNQDSMDKHVGLSHYMADTDLLFDWFGDEWFDDDLEYCGVVDTMWLGGPDNSVLIKLNLGTHKKALSETKVLIVENNGKIQVENISFVSLTK